MATLLEADNSTKAMLASSALLGISRSQRDPSLAQGNWGLGQMATFFGRVEHGPEILEFLKINPLPGSLDLVKQKAAQLQEAASALVEGRACGQEDLQALEYYLRNHRNYYQELLQRGITGKRRCWN